MTDQPSPLAVFAADAHCFGCGPANPEGLHIDVRRVGEHAVEATYTVPPHYCGATGVVHGGIQATVLDEVMGKAAQTALPDGDARRIVTAEIALRFRRSAPTGRPLVVRAHVARIEGSNVFIEAALCDESGDELTTATARWKILDRLRTDP
ncbi:MAG: PaaI family thioesterase [Chloroflexi bacterium]|nr:PaaI family thioesterase [Chloroflexota bacterium]